jgi:hypothetical protein
VNPREVSSTRGERLEGFRIVLVARRQSPAFFGIDMHQRQSVNMRGPRGTVPCEIGGAAAENRLPNGEP